MNPEDFTVGEATYEEIVDLRRALREEAKCQIVYDSLLRRGLADPFGIRVGRDLVGYAGVGREHFPHHLFEFFVKPERRADAHTMFDTVLRVSGATHIRAQTNLPEMMALFDAFSTMASRDKLLFEDGPATRLVCPGAVFRRRRAGDSGPDGEWVIERDGRVAAGGGILFHYNPPFGDVYMEVVPEFRRQGLGSFMVQELRRACREGGGTPSARCDPDNRASAATLLRGGFRRCGELLEGKVRREG